MAEKSEQSRHQRATDKGTMIGTSVRVKGDITSDENVTIDGAVEGKIDVGDNTLTVGTNGRLKVEASAKAVAINGHVTGEVNAQERIRVGAGATVEGDLVAPSILLTDGAVFEGSISCKKPGGQRSSSVSGVQGGLAEEMSSPSTESKTTADPFGSKTAATAEEKVTSSIGDFDPAKP